MGVLYEKLQRDPIAGKLFNSKINTIEELQSILKSSNPAFVALDTEHAYGKTQSDRILHQLGLAYLDSMLPEDAGQENSTSCGTKWGRIQEFYDENRVQGLTLNIKLSGQTQDTLIRYRGRVPFPRPHRFGKEKHINPRDLESSVIQYLENCCANEKKLVLVGFEMAAEWECLFYQFPQALPYFSHWMDLQKVASNLAPACPLPGRITLLNLFGYHWKDITPGYHQGPTVTVSDNAGDDAVSIFALGNALLYKKNQEALKFRQECGRIARIHLKKKGDFIAPEVWRPFAVTMRAEAGPLPQMYDSGIKLAKCFFDLRPNLTGLVSCDTAYLTFTNQDDTDQFIQATNGLELSTGERLSSGPAEMHCPQIKAAQEQLNKMRKEKRQMKENQKALEKSEETDIISDLGALFS